MSKINRKFFFDVVRLHLYEGRLSKKQVEGMTSLLDYWEKNHSAKDDRWLAYVLATTHHEACIGSSKVSPSAISRLYNSLKDASLPTIRNPLKLSPKGERNCACDGRVTAQQIKAA